MIDRRYCRCHWRARGGGAPGGLGIPARDEPAREGGWSRGRGGGEGFAEVAGEEFPEEGALRPLLLRLGERLQEQALHPAGQRVGEARELEQVRRPGQQEAAGPAVGIDRGLDGEQEFGCTLDLVDGDALGKLADEAGAVIVNRR